MSEKPKIIVDEDWKTQVQAEKESLEKKKEEPKPQAAAPAEPPPPSLTMLMTTLATQAMVSLGEVPHPLTGKAEIHLDEAKHMIDMLQMLEQKTDGNRTPEETAMLRGLLHQLRMAYVIAQRTPPAGPAATA